MNKEFVIVTSLFNIRREEMDKRAWEEYLKWFDITLKLKCPMVIFIEEGLQKFVEERRKAYPTEIIIQNIEEVPYYYLKPRLDDIVSSEEYKNKISDPDRIECKHSMYSIIQYSKFKWLETAIQENPFNSKYFFWLDAGASRFFEDFDLSVDYPSPNAIEALESMGDKFLIQMNMEFYKDLVESEHLPKDYLFDNRSYILGSMFGGGKSSVLKVSKDIENIFVNDMVENNFVNNEQISLGYLVKKNSNDFEIFERYTKRHLELFLEMSKR